MKKFILLSLVLIGLTSCNMQFYDEDGFNIFWLGAVMDRGYVLVQSHEGYMVEKEGVEKIYTERKFKLPVEIQNITNQTIDVKITTHTDKYWQEIDANSTLLLED